MNPFRITDGHAHLPLRHGAVEKLLATMVEMEIGRTIVVAGGALSPEALSENMVRDIGVDTEIDNAGLFAECQKAPDKLLPFYFANPHRGSDAYEKAGSQFYGLKLGPAVHGVALNDTRHLDLATVAQAFGHPIYLHCLNRGGFGVDTLVKLAKQFPKVDFILGHAGVGHFDFYGVSLIATLSNIYFETSGGFSSVVKRAVEVLGIDRVLFGSEYPLQDPQVEIFKMKRLGLSDSDLEKVLASNSERLLNRSGGIRE